MFIYGDSGKMPFEDRVVEYLKTMPNGETVADCAKSIGISEAAVECVLANLEAHGQVEYKNQESK